MTQEIFLGWAALSVIAVATRLWLRGIQQVEIPKNRGGFIASWVLTAGLAIAALAGEPGWIGGIPASLALFAATFFLFTIAIGSQKVGDDVIRVGDSLPAFTATDEHGEIFDSADLVGHPVLIKFFRAHW